MTIEPKVIAGPIKEPISVAEAALQMRADYSDEDSLYEMWIAAARDYVESQAAITMHEKTLEITLDWWPNWHEIELPRATPLISVTSLIYYDSDGTPTTMDPADYIVDTDSRPGRIVLQGGYSGRWPSVTLQAANGIRIRYKAGIATTSPPTEAPGSMKHPVALLVNAFDRNRSAEILSDRAAVSAISFRYGVETFIDRLRAEPNSF